MLNNWRDSTGVVKLYSIYVHICAFKLYSRKQKLNVFKKVKIIKVIQIIPSLQNANNKGNLQDR